jgi:hypothetical protein
LRTIDYTFFAKEENLNLLGRSDLRNFCRELGMTGGEIRTVRLFGLSSNLLLFVRKRSSNEKLSGVESTIV